MIIHALICVPHNTMTWQIPSPRCLHVDHLKSCYALNTPCKVLAPVCSLGMNLGLVTDKLDTSQI